MTTEPPTLAPDRAAAGEALRASAERCRALLDAVPLPVIVCDAETFRLLAANRAAGEISGFTPEELLAADPAGPGAPPELERLRALVQAPGPPARKRGVWTTRRKDGTAVELEVEVEELVLEGRPARMVVLGDVTARKRAEEERDRLQEQLRHAQKMEAVGRLAGGVAHDFNNMMTVISNFTEFVLADLPPESPMREDLEQIREAARRATALTAQLLAFSRRQLMQPRLVDANRLVAELERMLRRLIGENIALSCALAPRPLTLRVDPGQLEQALVNLVLNAREAMPAGGKLVLETALVALGADQLAAHPDLAHGDYVRLAVADTGAGMDAEAQRHAFEPFFTTKGRQHSGLGLATVYGIVEQSGGLVSIESEPGRGTAVRLHFPAVPGQVAPEPRRPEPAAAPAPASGTILVVEDEPLVRETVRTALQRLGYRVLLAANGDAAERIAREERGPLDLVLTDVVMPGADGPTVARRLTALRPGLRVLFMSGYTDNPVVRNGLGEQGIAFLEKPFTQEKLAGKIREVLAGGR